MLICYMYSNACNAYDLSRGTKQQLVPCKRCELHTCVCATWVVLGTSKPECWARWSPQASRRDLHPRQPGSLRGTENRWRRAMNVDVVSDS